MQCLSNKIQQRMLDSFCFLVLPLLEMIFLVSTVACTSTFIYKNRELSNSNHVLCLLPLNNELSFKNLKTTVKEFNFEFVNEDSLYEEFPGAKIVVNAVKTGSLEQSLANIFCDLRNKQTDVPTLNTILGVILNIPSSNANNEIAFSLMS
jgi:hypothetical protein